MMKRFNLSTCLAAAISATFLAFCVVSIHRVQPHWWWHIQTAAFLTDGDGMREAGFEELRRTKYAKDKARILLWMTQRTSLLHAHATEEISEAIANADYLQEYIARANLLLASKTLDRMERDSILVFRNEASEAIRRK